MQLSTENQRWLEAFRANHGRTPRILHIGNIANNAYNNVRLLNEAGLDCDVICYDYYHIMGCPEWEDADFSDAYGDQFRPDWAAAQVVNFERPRWFAQGPVYDCIEYLVAKREGNNQYADNLWLQLATANGTLRPDNILLTKSNKPRVQYSAIVKRLIRVLSSLATSNNISSKIAARCDSGRIAKLTRLESLRILAALTLLSIALIVRIIGFPLRRFTQPTFDETVAKLIKGFTAAFPLRRDKLTGGDLEMYRQVTPRWQRLFGFYDLIQAYATDPILPMLTGKRPYVGFEHGTLRSHTLSEEAVCRLTSLAYYQADHVFITNGDCIEYAQKIGVMRFSPMLHPVDERRIMQIDDRYEDLRRELKVRYVFLCTLRHDWAIKGTDHYIRALPELASKLKRDFRVVMTRWGNDLEKSMSLAKSLGVSDLIIWSEPLSRRKLIQMLKSSDALFDQIALPHFGATAPEGIAANIPVIMSYNPASTAWLVAEPAPILSAHNADEIVTQVMRALDPDWRNEYRLRAKKWFDTHHSFRLVVQGHLDIYRSLIPAS